MKRKVILYFMIIILLTLGLVMFCFSIGIRQYYYKGIADTFQKQAEVVTPVWIKQTDFIKSKLSDYSDEIIKNYYYQGVELQLLKRNGQLIQSSTGFYEGKIYSVDPSVMKYKTIYKIEKNGYSGEKIMAVYTPLIFDGQVIGILRYSTSLKKVDAIIFNLIGYGIIICSVVAGIVFLVSLQLGNSIVRPLNDIIRLTQKMAEGRYKEKIEKVYLHEPGIIVKMLNNMGDEIIKSDQLKNTFISSISHELRTPLTGIKGWVETMRDPDGLTEEEMYFGLGIINDETERLISLVETLLDFSKYQSDRIKLNCSAVNIDKLIHEVAFQLQKKADKKEVQLIVETSSITLTADGDKLKQVFLNILDNAIKFSNTNGKIYINQLINHDLVSIKICDTGVGIKQENLDYIMEPFYKIDPKSLGEGLGLAISRNIVELHGGTLKIESEYGKGTLVVITLPLITH